MFFVCLFLSADIILTCLHCSVFSGAHDCTVSVYERQYICTYRIRSGVLPSDDDVEPGDGGERVQDEGGEHVFMKSDSLAAQTPAQITTNHSRPSDTCTDNNQSQSAIRHLHR